MFSIIITHAELENNRNRHNSEFFSIVRPENLKKFEHLISYGPKITLIKILMKWLVKSLPEKWFKKANISKSD